MSLVLHHFPTAVCAAKVRVVLAEKELAWESRLVDLQAGNQWRPDYLALNPDGVVPTLVDGGAVVVDSTLICEYLDEAFPAIPLRPPAPLERAGMRQSTMRENAVHQAINGLTTALVFRPHELAKPAAAQAARIAAMPAARRERWREAMRDGAQGRAVAEAVAVIAALVADMKRRLDGGDWLAGGFSLADTGMIAFVDRLDRLGLDGSWRSAPRVADWLARMRSRPSVIAGIDDWLANAPPLRTVDLAARDAVLAAMMAAA